MPEYSAMPLFVALKIQIPGADSRNVGLWPESWSLAGLLAYQGKQRVAGPRLFENA